MADSSTLFPDLLQKLIGQSKSTDSTEQLDVTNLINQLTQSQGTQNTATNQNVTGTTNQNVTGTTNQTQTTQADVSALQKVFQQQQAGITPDQLKAIFTEGAKQVPGLVATTANAVGARAGNNSPLAAALTDLNTNLTTQAANVNAQMLKDSGTTAAQIADLTKSLTTSGTSGQATTGTTGQSTTGTQNTTSNQSTSSNTNQTQNSGKTTNVDESSTINAKSTGLTAGAFLLGDLLKNGGGSTLGGLGSGAASLISKLFGGGSGSLSDWLTSGGQSGSIDDWLNSNTDWTDSGGDTNWWDTLFGFKDGGRIPIHPGMADGGLLQAPQLTFGLPKKSRQEEKQDANLLAEALAGGGSSSLGSGMFGSSGSSGASSSSSGSSVGVSGDSGPGVGVSSSPNTAGVSSMSPSAALGLMGQMAMTALAPTPSNVLGLVNSLSTQVNNAIALSQEVNAQQQAIDSFDTTDAAVAAASAAAQADTDPDSNGSVGDSVGASEGIGSDSGGVGSAAGADNGGGGVSADSGDSSSGASSGGDSAGDSGDGGDSGDSGDSGYANGGVLPRDSKDPKGIKDRFLVPMSGGEYVMPKDVVDFLGVDFLDGIKNLLHTPANQQQAPGSK